MSLINSLRSGVGWISQRSVTARELIKSAKSARLRLASRHDNAEFAKSHPDKPLPPLDLMADAHAHCNYRLYYESGLFQAQFSRDMFGRYFDFDGSAPVYHEWDEVGRRDFFAWHPPQYVRSVFLSGLEELEYVSSEDSGLNKDMWLARVPR